MSRNLLPFQREERARYSRSSWMSTKLLLLRRGQTRTLRRAAGVIFPTEFARRVVSSDTQLTTKSRVIPYGVSEPFFLAPRPQAAVDPARPYRLLYVSTVDVYKHQWHVATAVASLRRRGLPVTLDLVGHAYPPALDRLTAVCRALDPAGAFIHYRGPATYADLPRHYHTADAFVFASSCESMSNVLMEAMAAGLPIACADRGPMPDVLGDAGVYFDPEDPAAIADAVAGLLASPADRTAFAARAFARAGGQSWRRCADETFQFLREVFNEWDARAR
jgi:glycosyltransferase involved in cell wall biosynthesis